MILSIFSCVCWPFLLYHFTVHDHCPFLKWIAWDLLGSWILILPQLNNLHMFSLMLLVASSLYWWCPLHGRSIYSWDNLIYICFNCLCFWVLYQKVFPMPMSSEFCWCFPLVIWWYTVIDSDPWSSLSWFLYRCKVAILFHVSVHINSIFPAPVVEETVLSSWINFTWLMKN